jgi:hypothetical protein
MNGEKGIAYRLFMGNPESKTKEGDVGGGKG